MFSPDPLENQQPENHNCCRSYYLIRLLSLLLVLLLFLFSLLLVFDCLAGCFVAALCPKPICGRGHIRIRIDNCLSLAGYPECQEPYYDRDSERDQDFGNLPDMTTTWIPCLPRGGRSVISGNA